MQVFQIRVKLYLLQCIEWKELSMRLSRFIDTGLCQNDKYLELHKENMFKYYTFDQLYPLEEDKIYKADNIYTLTIRTLIPALADFFSDDLVHMYNRDMKALTAERRVLPQKKIEQIYTLTPVLLKDVINKGYWRNYMTTEDFERFLKMNLVKKWNDFFDEEIDKNFRFYDKIEFLNRKPISLEYKNINLLGDRIRLTIADNDMAQKMAYFSLGTGLLTANSRGFGFVNYRYK